jgi:Flp pilus assembly protein TadB
MIFVIGAVVLGVALIVLLVWFVIARRRERIAAGLPVGRERWRRKKP